MNPGGAEAAPCLYRTVLGHDWALVPHVIRALHEAPRARGRVTVERGTGRLARLAAALAGFPGPCADVAAEVSFHARRSTEVWTRTFGDETFSSRLFPGRGGSAGLVCERFGPLTFAMRLIPDAGRIRLRLERWSFLAVPLPLSLAPRPVSFEAAEDGRFWFFVEISHPLTGLIVRYRGWLLPAAA